MIPKIKPEQLDNQFFSIKGSKIPDATVMFVDFQYGGLLNNPSTSIPTISPNVFQKTFHLSPLAFSSKNLTIETIQNEMNKNYIQKISELGEQHRELEITLAKKFDINVNNMKRKGIPPERGIIAKFYNASNLLATEGRIGPAQFIVSNSKTYSYILNFIGSMQFLYKGNELWIGNMPYIINESVEDEKILLSRKNQIDQPGVHCLIMVDDDGYIMFQEMFNPDNFDTKLVMNYCIDSVGYHPYYQIMKLDIRDIAYYRNKKLQRIKEIYG